MGKAERTRELQPESQASRRLVEHPVDLLVSERKSSTIEIWPVRMLATIVRSVVIAAAMGLLVDRNWYPPGWLIRLPDV